MPKGSAGDAEGGQAEIPLNPKEEHWKRVFDKVSRDVTGDAAS